MTHIPLMGGKTSPSDDQSLRLSAEKQKQVPVCGGSSHHRPGVKAKIVGKWKREFEVARLHPGCGTD